MSVACPLLNCCDITPFSYAITALAARYRVWVVADPPASGTVKWESSGAVLRNSIEAIVGPDTPVTVIATARGTTPSAEMGGEGSGETILGEGGETWVEEYGGTSATYTFDGWYNGDTLVSSNSTYTFTPTANITLTARFSEA